MASDQVLNKNNYRDLILNGILDVDSGIEMVVLAYDIDCEQMIREYLLDFTIDSHDGVLGLNHFGFNDYDIFILNNDVFSNVTKAIDYASNINHKLIILIELNIEFLKTLAEILPAIEEEVKDVSDFRSFMKQYNKHKQ